MYVWKLPISVWDWHEKGICTVDLENNITFIYGKGKLYWGFDSLEMSRLFGANFVRSLWIWKIYGDDKKRRKKNLEIVEVSHGVVEVSMLSLLGCEAKWKF